MCAWRLIDARAFFGRFRVALSSWIGRRRTAHVTSLARSFVPLLVGPCRSDAVVTPAGR